LPVQKRRKKSVASTVAGRFPVLLWDLEWEWHQNTVGGGCVEKNTVLETSNYDPIVNWRRRKLERGEGPTGIAKGRTTGAMIIKTIDKIMNRSIY